MFRGWLIRRRDVKSSCGGSQLVLSPGVGKVAESAPERCKSSINLKSVRSALLP